MGFDLGMAAVAYQGAKAEQRRTRDDDFRKAQNDYAVANMDEQQGRRGYRDNAAQLADAEVASRTELLPQETSARKAALDAESRDRQFAEDTRGDREETTRLGLKTAKAKAKEAHAWSEEEHAANGQKIDEAIIGNEEKAHQLRQGVLASLYQFGAKGGGQERDIVGRLNAVTRSKLFPDLHGKTIGSAKKVGGNMELRDPAGELIQSIPFQQMKAAYEGRGTPAKNVVKLSDGQEAYSMVDGKMVPIASNRKDFNPNSGGGRGSGSGGRGRGSGGAAGGSKEERIMAAMIAEAKGRGVELGPTEAYRMLQSNPSKAYAQALRADPRLQYESNQEKRSEIEAGHRNSLGITPPPQKPGLSAPAAKSNTTVNKFLGL
ncbi:MAG: hypothetical protein WKF61_01020 [Luteimonas sp.]